MVDIDLDKVVECETALGLSIMTSADMKFLMSFIKVMRPIVAAMKLIDGESHCYVGQLIPTIMGLQRKLQTAGEDPTMKPLTEAQIAGLRKRFDCTLQSEEHQVSTMLHPKFKLAFLPVEQSRMQGRQLLLKYVEQVQREVAEPSALLPGGSSSEADDDEDFYSFLNKPEQAGSSLSDEVIIIKSVYLSIWVFHHAG